MLRKPERQALGGCLTEYLLQPIADRGAALSDQSDWAEEARDSLPWRSNVSIGMQCLRSVAVLSCAPGTRCNRRLHTRIGGVGDAPRRPCGQVSKLWPMRSREIFGLLWKSCLPWFQHLFINVSRVTGCHRCQVVTSDEVSPMARCRSKGVVLMERVFKSLPPYPPHAICGSAAHPAARSKNSFWTSKIKSLPVNAAKHAGFQLRRENFRKTAGGRTATASAKP